MMLPIIRLWRSGMELAVRDGPAGLELAVDWRDPATGGIVFSRGSPLELVCEWFDARYPGGTEALLADNLDAIYGWREIAERGKQ